MYFRQKTEAELNEAARLLRERNEREADAALEWLHDRNIFNTPREYAYDTANRFRYDELVDEFIRAGGVCGFNGDDNCADDCCGWDGESHRCDCGNRRMTWTEGCDTDYRNMYIYAEAY